jgi:hypothetical protein
VSHETVHRVEGKPPSERSLYTPQSLIMILRKGLGRHRASARGEVAADFDQLLEVLADLEGLVGQPVARSSVQG